jgi:hypothetical protein
MSFSSVTGTESDGGEEICVVCPRRNRASRVARTALLALTEEVNMIEQPSWLKVALEVIVDYRFLIALAIMFKALRTRKGK